uniref:Uncharacterized protein n=1 Tax=Plectus sambesii TaxID=2011161 RepID=A0A914XJP0_9BILA
MHENNQLYVVERSAKHNHVVPNASRDHYTVVEFVNADGQKLAPFTIFKGGLPHRAYHLVRPADAAYRTSESGYINEELFGECLTNFGNHVRGRLCIKGTLLLLMVGFILIPAVGYADC